MCVLHEEVYFGPDVLRAAAVWQRTVLQQRVDRQQALVQLLQLPAQTQHFKIAVLRNKAVTRVARAAC